MPNKDSSPTLKRFCDSVRYQILFPLLSVLLLTGLLGHFGCGDAPRSAGPDIVLITLDTTRADRLGCYGYHRETSPNIDRFAAHATRYDKAFAPSSWTLPSHASLFTGKFTASHGARFDPDGPLQLVEAIRTEDPRWGLYRARGLSRDETTLAQILKEAGYATGAVVGGPWMKRVFGLDRGFDHYDDSGITSVEGRRAREVSDAAIGWLQEHRREKLFLFVNYYDPHAPYDPPAGYSEKFVPTDPGEAAALGLAGVQRAAYDAEILYMDYHLGRLLKTLKASKRFEGALIILTADHGELLGEHGTFGHGKSLYHPELRIPLIVKQPGPDNAQASVPEPVQLVDVFSLVLEKIGISPPEGIQGESPGTVTHPIIAELYPLPALTGREGWRAIIEWPYKYLWNDRGNHALVNLEKDPEETRNLLAREPQISARLASALAAYIQGLPAPGETGPAQEVDAETQEALKSLGYIE